MPAGRRPGDRIGHAITIDGPTLVVGAPGDDGLFGEFPDSGAVYSFRLPVTATFVNPTPFASWNDPANWDVGVVPSPGDAVVVPAGTYPELPVGPAATIDTLSVTGQLRLRGDLRVETSSTIATLATVDLQPTATFDPSGDVTLDGLLNNAGPVVIDGPGSITGSGRFVNDDVLRKTGSGTLTIGPDVVWTSRFYSELDVAGGSVEILGDLVDDNGLETATVTAGTFRVAAGTSLEFDENLIVGPGTTFVTELSGPPSSTANYGRVVVGSALGFDRTVPNPGPGLVGFEAVVNGYDVDAADVYPVITCGIDCAPDLGSDVLSVEFDDLALSGLTPVQTRTTIDLRTVANKVVSSDPGVGFGIDLAVDGDLAVVGTLSGGPLWVYRYVAGAWEVAQSLSNGTAERVAVDGTTIFADGLRYNPVTPGGPFDADDVIGGTTFDIDNRLVVRGEPGGAAGTAVVRLAAGGADAALVPSLPDSTFGADVAIVDLGGASAIAAVSAPADGRVYLFDLAVDEGAGTVASTPRGFVSGGSDFGRSIALSADRLVVGDPFDGTPIAGAGAARVYERTGPGAVFAASPVKLQASDAEVSDTFGDDVAIDGDVIVVGAPIAQKFAFPLRDGAAYVYQFNGVSWVETDKLRADDGFSEEGFGDAVAVSGNRVLVGATSDANDNGADAGAFYFYETAPPPSPFTVTTTADAGPGSLRAAIDCSEHRVDRGRPRPDRHQLRHPWARAAHDLARHGTAEHHTTGGDRRVHAARKRCEHCSDRSSDRRGDPDRAVGSVDHGDRAQPRHGKHGKHRSRAGDQPVLGTRHRRLRRRRPHDQRQLPRRPPGRLGPHARPGRGHAGRILGEHHRRHRPGRSQPDLRERKLRHLPGSECDCQRHPRQLHRDRPDRDGGASERERRRADQRRRQRGRGSHGRRPKSDRRATPRSVFASRVPTETASRATTSAPTRAARSLSPTEAVRQARRASSSRAVRSAH